MSFIIDAITLPRFPENIDWEPEADIKSYSNPGNRYMLLVLGLKTDKLVIDGWLASAGSTKAQLTTNYITPLRAKLATQVTITCAGRPYSAETFVFAKMKFTERPGVARAYQFRMEFWKGEIHIIV